MHNTITVSFQRGLFNIISSIELATKDRIFGIKSSQEANEIASSLAKKYEEEGIFIEKIILWD